jgi:hypothetical protein
MSNRHERRRVVVLERKKVKLSELTGRMCAWDGCGASFKGDMPEGWTNLIMYWAPSPIPNVLDIPPADWLRDAGLCPEHTRLLESQLKDLGRAVSGPAAGCA